VHSVNGSVVSNCGFEGIGCKVVGCKEPFAEQGNGLGEEGLGKVLEKGTPSVLPKMCDLKIATELLTSRRWPQPAKIKARQNVVPLLSRQAPLLAEGGVEARLVKAAEPEGADAAPHEKKAVEPLRFVTLGCLVAATGEYEGGWGQKGEIIARRWDFGDGAKRADARLGSIKAIVPRFDWRGAPASDARGLLEKILDFMDEHRGRVA